MEGGRGRLHPAHFGVKGAAPLALVLAAPAFAQDNGRIRGAVTDDTGGVLPGVAVTPASDAIIGGSRTGVTTESGVFRFPQLAPGEYAVELSHAGLASARYEGVRIGQNTTATLDTRLSPSTLAETVQVVAEAPLLDVASNSQVTTLDSEFVEELPTERNFYDYFHQHDSLTFPEVFADAGTGAPLSEGTPNAFAYERDSYQDITSTLGGPIRRDRIWFMASGGDVRDSAWEAGNEPSMATGTGPTARSQASS